MNWTNRTTRIQRPGPLQQPAPRRSALFSSSARSRSPLIADLYSRLIGNVVYTTATPETQPYRRQLPPRSAGIPELLAGVPGIPDLEPLNGREPLQARRELGR